MSFIIPDLVIESVIRDGIENMKAKPEVLDDVFADLTKPYADRKYGEAEITKIKNLLTGANKQNLAIVHSFHEAAAKSPCVSIQLGNDIEDRKTAHINDFEMDLQEPITDATDLQNLVKVENLTPDAYDPVSGRIDVADSVDLSMVHKNYLYVDGDGTEFALKGGISNTTGSKFFFIEPQSDVNIVDPGEIKSFLDIKQIEIRGVRHNVQLLIGVHAKDALLTKYLYTLVKYFLLSRKKDLIKRCFANASLSGSDFTRDLRYEGDMVFTRFLTIDGQVEDSWRSDQVDLIDSVEIDADPIDC